VPGIEVKTSQMPKLFRRAVQRRDLGAARRWRDVIHSSFWDGTSSPILRAARRADGQEHDGPHHGETAMHKLAAQIPDGTVLGARRALRALRAGQRLQPLVRKRLRVALQAPPNYASYQMAQAILGVKLAWERRRTPAAASVRRTRQVGKALST